jgi:hypothetical protein
LPPRCRPVGSGDRPAGTGALRRRAVDRFALDLAGFLNRLRAEELRELACAAGLPRSGRPAELRVRLWLRGAEIEAGGAEHLGQPWQPLPVVLGGKLVHLGEERGLAPPATAFPRPIPPPRPVPRAAGLDEPETLEDLLARASRLLGVRLGRRGRDKGAYGVLVAALLGVPERGHPEPDWRGEVEVKTVPVARDPSGFWRVVEDPAVSMEHAEPLAKLGRVLWIARVADADGAPVLSWYYQERDGEVARMIARHLHRRPKGARGARTRGWYLRKRFFAESGFLKTLNG